VADQTLPQVPRHQFKTADSEYAHAFIWQNYGDYTLRFSGSPNGFTLRRALAFIDAHAGEDIGIAEIAEAARIGPRGLQRAFRQYRDTTPMEYLRRVRLDHAHRELLAGDPSRGDTVSAVAARWGFAHAGRFSAAYYAAYGCFPS